MWDDAPNQRSTQYTPCQGTCRTSAYLSTPSSEPHPPINDEQDGEDPHAQSQVNSYPHYPSQWRKREMMPVLIRSTNMAPTMGTMRNGLTL